MALNCRPRTSQLGRPDDVLAGQEQDEDTAVLFFFFFLFWLRRDEDTKAG